MPKHTYKKQEDKSRATATGIPAPQSNEKSSVSFFNKPTLQAYQEMADNSPRVKQLKKYQAMAHGVIQLHLADDLNSKKVNVAVAGERHDEIPDNEEQAAWGQAGIKVHYEADSIPLNDNSGPDVTPDPLKLRLAFGFTALKEYVSPYLESGFKPGKSSDVDGAKNAAEVLDYLLPVLINDLRRAPDSQASKINPIVVMLKELRAILKDGKLTAVVDEELARRVLVSKVKRDLELVGAFIGDVHSKSAFKAVDFKSVPLRVARSQQMLERINNAAGSLDNTIYKVGNNHVLDMEQAKWPPGPKVAVLDRAKYLSEYQTLGSRRAPRAAVSSPKPGVSVVPSGVPSKSPALGSPVPAPVKSGVHASEPKSKGASNLPSPQLPGVGVVPVPKGPVSGGSAPVKLPAQSPAPLVASEPKRKSRPKEVKPKVPEKSAAEVKVEQMQQTLSVAPDKVKSAQGYQDIERVLGYYNNERMGADNVIAQVKLIIKERNERWSITKFFVRSNETQQLYDDLSTIVGE